MIDKNDELYRDFEAVRQISIVPTMLDVVCRITGMGFAAVARVTEDRWLACSVNDQVNFGLAEGGELKIETTICNEIRDSKKEVVFDNVIEDEIFRHHHTPKMYGLQSYISFPIILKNGEFFGTLCAIDSKPASVNRPEVRGTFKLFAELLAFHLDSMALIDRSQSALQETNKQLNYSNTENQLYRQISGHNIQEQVRKIALFSDILATNTKSLDIDKIQNTAEKINNISVELSNMIHYVTKYSALNSSTTESGPIDLNEILSNVCIELADDLGSKRISVTKATLPVITGIPLQLKELFLHLINYAIVFSTEDSSTAVNIYAREIDSNKINQLSPEQKKLKFCEIHVEQTGVEADTDHIENVFDIFLHLSGKQSTTQYGAGLAYCRKIVQSHGGSITAKALSDTGISFIIILPYNLN